MYHKFSPSVCASLAIRTSFGCIQSSKSIDDGVWIGNFIYKSKTPKQPTEISRQRLSLRLWKSQKPSTSPKVPILRPMRNKMCDRPQISEQPVLSFVSAGRIDSAILTIYFETHSQLPARWQGIKEHGTKRYAKNPCTSHSNRTKEHEVQYLATTKRTKDL